jgi:glycosyltransferase involved in cell wall biosynthesis
LNEIRVAFLMEQHLGHRVYGENLRREIDRLGSIEATWVDVTYDCRPGPLARSPMTPEALRGPLCGRAQVLDGLRRSSPVVTLYNTQVPAVLAGRAALAGPYVLCTDITPRQYDRMAEHYGHAPDGAGLVGQVKHRLNRRVFKRAARVLPWSTWARDSLVAEYGVDPSRVEVVPPGVDLERWKSGRRQAADRPLRVLFVGGDLHRKGGQALVDVVADLPPDTAELHLVTRTPYDAGDRNVHVHRGLQPNSPELIALYQRSDVFVLPSRGEAFGIAAVEASATGLPVIGARTGGLADVVDHGTTGFLVAAGDQTELGRRIRSLSESVELRERFGRAARARAEERFDAAANAARIAGVLLEVAGKSDDG